MNRILQGILRDLSKVPPMGIQDPSVKPTEQVSSAPCEEHSVCSLSLPPPGTILFLARVYHCYIIYIFIYLCVCVGGVCDIQSFLCPFSHVCLSQSDGEANDSDAVTQAAELVSSSNGDNSAVTVER
jgi:hypothetical protein